MANNKKVASFAIEPKLHDELKEYANKKGLSLSGYLTILVSQGLKLSIDDDPIVIGKPSGEEILPVILKIPANLKGDREGLQKWMDQQTAGIVSKLS